MDLTAKLLIAMPGMTDPRFSRAVIFICTHDPDKGAMGLVINHIAPRLTFSTLLKQSKALSTIPSDLVEMPIHVGGPVENGRGFVLHSSDYELREQTLRIGQFFSMTATIDILLALARGQGPKNAILALGYSGWGAGQLESEILQNAWLTADPTEELVFHCAESAKWDRALSSLGVDPRGLSANAGHA